MLMLAYRHHSNCSSDACGDYRIEVCARQCNPPSLNNNGRLSPPPSAVAPLRRPSAQTAGAPGPWSKPSAPARSECGSPLSFHCQSRTRSQWPTPRSCSLRPVRGRRSAGKACGRKTTETAGLSFTFLAAGQPLTCSPALLPAGRREQNIVWQLTTDNGTSWSAPSVVAHNDGSRNGMPGMARLHNGTLVAVRKSKARRGWAEACGPFGGLFRMHTH